MAFLAGFFLGFLFCFISAYSLCSKANKMKNKYKALLDQNERLIKALQNSGARISVYKMWNQTYLRKLGAIQNRREELMDILREMESD